MIQGLVGDDTYQSVDLTPPATEFCLIVEEPIVGKRLHRVADAAVASVRIEPTTVKVVERLAFNLPAQPPDHDGGLFT